MRAITVIADQELELADVPDPTPGPGEVLVRVAATGVNRADVLQRAGHYPPPPGTSDVMGLEVSGTIAALGEGVTAWREGEQVAALLAGGGYAELVAVPAGQLLPVPAGLDLVDAAALPEAVCTAWANLVQSGGLTNADTVLVHGGSGGVGSAAIQLAAALGARVLTTAGGPERAARCRELGADLAIDYRAQDVVEEVERATDGRGVDVILDVLGAGGLPGNVRMLATNGRLVVIGTQKGRKGELDLGLLMTKRASIHAATLRARPLEEKAAVVADVRERAWPLLDDGRLRPVISHRVPLAEAARAHELLENGQVFGKVLLLP
ncbi:NAD(P)H-quinone oxidoreductase [Georgenia sp. AZ-5]|uniref:NAD(P)H-quinone oxidoreductase n=1 Tax=Georgenia sp. AZ-5 TaxID=3367526 RepID=UPI0037543948